MTSARPYEAEIAALAPIRNEALAKRAAAREKARLARPAADSAKELLDSLKESQDRARYCRGSVQ